MCERPQIYNEARRKANKNHNCSECDREIKKGESYFSISGLWDGKWSNYKYCQHCISLRDYLEENREDFDCVPIGGLYSELIDCEVIENDGELWVSNDAEISVACQEPLLVEVIQ